LPEPFAPSRLCASSRPLLALPAADEGPRGIGELHRWVGVEAAVDGVRFGPDGMRDAALTRTAALKERLRESMKVARAKDREASMLSRGASSSRARTRELLTLMNRGNMDVELLQGFRCVLLHCSGTEDAYEAWDDVDGLLRPSP
jgi:hypothetical protein